MLQIHRRLTEAKRENMEKLDVKVGQVILLTVACFSGSALKCDSLQHLELNKTGVINCFIENPFFGIYWYNSTDSTNNDPMLSIEGSKLGGYLYPSNEFQLLKNGSLSISYVKLQHEHTYRVVLIVDKNEGIIKRSDIDVVVFVNPVQSYPYISDCKRERECVIQRTSTPALQCTIRGARPAANITWILPTALSDIHMSSNTSFVKEKHVFSTSTTMAKTKFNSTVLLVCKALNKLPKLKFYESYVFIETSSNIPNVEIERKSKTVEMGKQVTLTCPTNEPVFVKWDRTSHHGKIQNIGITVFSDSTYSKEFIDGYEISGNASLIINRTLPDHEGIFRCTTGDGITNQRRSFNVTVIAFPKPEFPIVHGCADSHSCVLEVKNQSELRCSVVGIRPLVQLQWMIMAETLDNTLFFSNDNYQTSSNEDGTFNISLATDVTFSALGKTYALACKTTLRDKTLSSRFHIISRNGDTVSPSPTISVPTKLSYTLWMIVISIAAVLVVVYIIIYSTFYRVRRVKNNMATETIQNDQEMEPMFNDENLKQSEIRGHSDEPISTIKTETYESKKDVFLQHLYKKYQMLYDAITPIPFIRKKICRVSNIYIDHKIEKNILGGAYQKTNGQKMISNFHELLIDEETKGTRKIIQGDPGLGKSTLTLQMAYEWCTGKNKLTPQDKELLILLRLRHLNDIPSIYKAIKLLLLPQDTVLTDRDIRQILQRCSSAVIILDGFDEYQQKNAQISTDVHKIIKGDMFQNFLVLVFTRPSSVPSSIPPCSQHIRLIGFDIESQQQYVRKAITDNQEVASKIRTRLKENPILGDLCEVPLFFVMFAHITFESDEFQQVNSVTSFFRYVIACFHSHFQNKLMEENVVKYKKLQQDHMCLDKLAFEGVQNNKSIWSKTDICEKIGKEHYNYYLNLGILCEEEVLELLVQDKTNEFTPYRTDVRFYHQLFCEWYAAHHLSHLSEKTTAFKTQRILKTLDLFHAHYVLRFACGLNDDIARRVLKYLDSTNEGDKFSSLCVLEQKGKFSDIKESVSKLCAKEILLRENDNRVAQRSTIQLLIIASQNEVPISSLWIRNCLKSIDSEKECAHLKTGLDLPRLSSLVNVHLYSEKTNMTLQETENFIRYALLSSQIKEIWFNLCEVPYFFSKSNVLPSLNQRKVTVRWMPNSTRTFTLDNDGQWMDKEGKKWTSHASNTD